MIQSFGNLVKVTIAQKFAKICWELMIAKYQVTGVPYGSSKYHMVNMAEEKQFGI